MKRRQFLGGAGLILGAGTLVGTSAGVAEGAAPGASPPIAAGDWVALRDLFPLTRDYVQLATFLLASHPRPVSEAIEAHRRAFDENPADYWHAHFQTIDREICQSAAAYMGGAAKNIALTDSTTMGLAMVYSGLDLAPGDEVLHSVHDHYSTDMSIEYRAQRTGARVRKIVLYEDPAAITVKDCVERIRSAISDRTRVVAMTWVHSVTGVKLPIRAIADALETINSKRSEERRILFCVDGVHGFGIENEDISQLGCDFFMAGTHKWMFGPRGTGVIWGSDRGWQQCKPVIPSFSASYDTWMGLAPEGTAPTGEYMTPGGFHAFEHRWSLPKAFELHLQLDKAKVQSRIHQLNTQTKEGLAAMSHVKLYTPMSPDLSSGLVCFDVEGMHADTVVKRLHDKGIIMSSTPYREVYSRFAPSLLNSEQDIEQALAAIRELA
ncbi:aminotransferase class V-fold PLP-dependent enzyme [Parahaliea aestuarii]|uniref:Aminotransferase class V-fold PLP-dependent enzyme n=1 Tax=Parahaliea aestuarii TaxID=1852021 RepID=A0A5C8ZXM6_9GAMM|nr:aminotransferase class V-fold PLP-dependent enzyme [Parahaliea aestuarii]TXS93226.1 aminotransferase class V-fold PLP-dependent enzyme [Parahaliea aestuarii]